MTEDMDWGSEAQGLTVSVITLLDKHRKRYGGQTSFYVAVLDIARASVQMAGQMESLSKPARNFDTPYIG